MKGGLIRRIEVFNKVFFEDIFSNFASYATIFWVINFLVALVVVFWTKRQAPTIWAWLLILVFLPVVGWLIYLAAGRRITDKQIFDLTSQDLYGLNDLRKEKNEQKLPKEYQPLTTLLNNVDQAPLTIGNQITRYTDGPAFFKELLSDINNAQDTINFEFFTIYNDKIGNQIIDALTKKAQQGLTVRVIYDQFGSHGRHKRMYKRLIEAGGIALPFLTRPFQLLALRINFRLHRKVVVIDGQIGYVGGYNVGDQYLGESKKFGFWRDTHLRIVGQAAIELQTRFITDWNATAKKKDLIGREEPLFFKHQKDSINSPIQIVSSGPDEERDQIKDGYLKMFALAKEEIIIQTPYFVPDQTVLESLQLAQNSGVKIKLMIPNKPDHPFVYRATQYYAHELLNDGAEIYRYDKGFLHTKIVIIDNQIASVGSTNLDIRSFELNFEANAFIYDSKFSNLLRNDFLKDVKDSKLLTKEDISKQGFWLNLVQQFSRLLTPIL